MNLNRISIGGGLAFVAFALLANAAVSLVGNPDRVANADGMKRADKRQQEPVADAVVPRQDEGGAGTMAMGAGDGCHIVEGEPLEWFGEIRLLGRCREGWPFLNPSRTPLTYADVDGDGRDERIQWSRYRVIEPDGPSNPCQIFMETPSFDGEDVIVERSCVLSTEVLSQWLQQEFAPTQASIVEVVSTAEWSGWSDIDGDGDLDLILIVWVSGGSVNEHIHIWVENTGFEKQQFAAGDINQDGNVDGVDISILLSDWSY